MPIRKRQTEKSGLEEAIDDLLLELKSTSAETAEYSQIADQLEKLYKLKEIDTPDRVKKDTLAVVGGNVAIALMIIAFEQHNVVTTKVSGFLSKLR